MFYFDGVLSTNAIEHVFTAEFIEKIQNGQSGLMIKILKGFSQPGSFPLCSARINDNERALFTFIIHNNRKQILLLDRLFHKEYDVKLKNKKLLQTYLNSKAITLNLTQLDKFDAEFDDLQDKTEEHNIQELFKAECLHSKAKILSTPARWVNNCFMVLDDAQEATINLNQNNLILGPPGSGKTIALKEICREMCRQANLTVEYETKTAADIPIRCLYLTPHAELAKRVASALSTELSENPWLRVLDYETFAREIDPVLSGLNKKMKRGIDDFVQWCKTHEIQIEQKPNLHKKQDADPDILYKKLYHECRMIAAYPSKTAYLKCPTQHSLFKNDETSRNVRFNLYVQYCNETLMGSYIPKGCASQPTLSGATERAKAMGKPLGYDLSFYDLSAALQQNQTIKTFCLDEIQNFPRRALIPFLSGRFRIHIAGDSDQSFYDPLSNLEFVRQSLLSNKVSTTEHVFTLSYRTSQVVAKVLTNFLTLQDSWCTQIGNDKTTNHRIQAAPHQKTGAASYYHIQDAEKIKMCKQLCEDPNYIVLVRDDFEIKALQENLDTELIFTIDQISGSEADHVICWDLLGIIPLPEKQVKKQHTKPVRSKDKHNTEGQDMITSSRKVYVCLSRAKESLIVFFNSQNKQECHIVQQLQHTEMTTLKPSEIKQDNPEPCIVTACPETYVKATDSLRFRSGWIKRCNELLQRASEQEEVRKQHLFLDKAKGILISKNLKPEDIQLPDNYELPPNYECFLSPLQKQLAFIKAVAHNCNEHSIKQLFNRPDTQELLLSHFTDAHGTDTTLWINIFSSQAKTLTFLTAIAKNENHTTQLSSFMAFFTARETKIGLHYYTILLMSKLWIKPEYQTINAIIKPIIQTILNKPINTSEDLYYAIAQHHFAMHYNANNEVSRYETLYTLSRTVINYKTLINAIHSNNIEQVKTLIFYLSNTEINESDKDGYTALLVAMAGKEAIVRALLTHPGIDIYKKTPDGSHALTMAVFFRRADVVEMLIAHDKEVINLPGKDGMTALALAKQVGDPSIIKLLHEKSQNIVTQLYPKTMLLSKSLINIEGLAKDDVLIFLYATSLQLDAKTMLDPMRIKANELIQDKLQRGEKLFFDTIDLLFGPQPIHVDLTYTSFNAQNYDRIYGAGAALKAIQEVKLFKLSVLDSSEVVTGTSVLDVTKKIAEFRDTQIKKVLNSIAQFGISPLIKIKPECPINVGFGSEKTELTVSVNYLDLKDCSKQVCIEAIHEAVWEEYTGIFGMSLERVWPFTMFSHPPLVVQEIQDRLWSNVVFVFKPPTEPCVALSLKLIFKKTDNFKGYSKHACHRYPRELCQDTFSRRRGQSLTSVEKATTPQLTEIKTNHVFSTQEIIAVLVPINVRQSFAKEFNQWFSGIKIISVPLTQKTKPLCKIPETLETIHKQQISKGEGAEAYLELMVPDYEGVLHADILKDHDQFSLHTVRLHTLFDFTLKYIENISKSTALLKKTEASTLIEYSNGSGWVAIHQAKIFQIDTSLLTKNKITLSSRFPNNTCLRDDLVTAKGKQKKVNRFVPNEQEIKQLKHIKRAISNMPDFSAIHVNYDSLLDNSKPKTILMLSFPEARQALINPKQLAAKGQELEADEVKAKAEADSAAKKLLATTAEVVIQENPVQKDYCAYYKLQKTKDLLEPKPTEASTGISELSKLPMAMKE